MTNAEELNRVLARELGAATPEGVLHEIRRLKLGDTMLRQIIQDLPRQRDWLDPEVETIARVVVQA